MMMMMMMMMMIMILQSVKEGSKIMISFSCVKLQLFIKLIHSSCLWEKKI